MILIKRYNRIALRTLAVSFLVLVLTLSTKAQLPKAREIAAKMGVGWNMGNTLEAICGETVWGGAITTQNLIDSVKAAGFTSVRLPVAWFCHSDTVSNLIDEDWMARVQEVVDYCINADLYVVMNIHWDTGWLENNINEASANRINDRQRSFWRQIAFNFKNYDERLIFAGANEPNVEDAKSMAILMGFHQTFVDAVRATGGNNSSRTLVIQGPSTDIGKTNDLMKDLPTDEIADRLIVEVHYYTPYQFCIMEEDASWGKVFYYWGKDYHSSTELDRNASWGEEAEMEQLFASMNTKYVKQGIPVILGEFGAYKRDLGSTSDQELHNASVEYFDRYTVKTAINNGIIPFYWATNYGIFDRSTGEVVDQGILDALMQGAAEGTYPVNVNSTELNDINIYPNPSTYNFTLTLENNTESIKGIKVFNVLGKEMEHVEVAQSEQNISFGSTLQPNLYTVTVYGEQTLRSFVILKTN